MNCPNCAVKLQLPLAAAFVLKPGDVLLCENPKCEVMLELTTEHAWRRIAEGELAQLPQRTRDAIRDARLELRIFRTNFGRSI